MTLDADEKFHALGDPIRRRLLLALRKGPLSVNRLHGFATEVTRPAVSQHLKILREAGLVKVEQRGTSRFYSLDWGGINGAMSWFGQFV